MNLGAEASRQLKARNDILLISVAWRRGVHPCTFGLGETRSQEALPPASEAPAFDEHGRRHAAGRNDDIEERGMVS